MNDTEIRIRLENGYKIVSNNKYRRLQNAPV